MQRFVRQQVAELIERLALEIQAAGNTLDTAQVHRLRVAARRLSTALRVFGEFVRPKAARKVRRVLRELMRASAPLRDRDIAIGLLGECGARDGDARLVALAGERSEAEFQLVSMLKPLAERGVAARWRQRLELSK